MKLLKGNPSMVNCVSCGKRLFWADSRNARRMNGECRACTAESQQEDNLDETEQAIAKVISEYPPIDNWRKLAEDGDVRAQYEMGWKYRNGSGVETDYEEAIKWWSMGAEQGDIACILPLAHLYRFGDWDDLGNGRSASLLADPQMAFEWYTIGAAKGDRWGAKIAQNKLGEMHKEGEGRLQDNVLAYMWFNIASANGDKDGRKNRDAIAKNMTPKAIEKATEMARECMASDYKKCGY
jgi:TPR repeat protein